MTTYKSKIDWWLLVILVIAMAAALFTSITAIFAGVAHAWWGFLLIAGLGVVLPLWVFLNTNYTLEPAQILIKSGPFTWRVPIASISSITPTLSPLSGPALSLDRLRIEYGQRSTIMISPRNKEQFLRDLEILRRKLASK